MTLLGFLLAGTSLGMITAQTLSSRRSVNAAAGLILAIGLALLVAKTVKV